MSRTFLALCKPRYLSPQKVYPKRAYSAQKSTVHRGNAFEERSLKLLEQTMSMSLKRVGGKEDGGIDLLGWWWLPYIPPGTPDADSSTSTSTSKRRRIRIIGQCKAEKKKMGPGYVRELEGVLYRFMSMPSSLVSTCTSNGEEESGRSPLGEETNTTTTATTTVSDPPGPERFQIPMVALLISESPFTKSALLRAHSSPIPFFLLHIPPSEVPPPINSPDTQNNNDDEGNSTGDQTDCNDDSLSNQQPLGNLGAAVCNPALAGAQGLLMGQLEVRWERSVLGGDQQQQQQQQQQQGRPALWWKNERLLSFTPDMSTSHGSVGEGEGEFPPTTAAADKIAK